MTMMLSISAVNCGQPPVSVGVTLTGSVFTYTNIVTFDCATGYEGTSAPVTATCLATAMWSASAPACTGEHPIFTVSIH